MHIVVIFHNIGGYHAARLRAAQSELKTKNWTLTAIQETDNADEHPWGDLATEITFPLVTLLPSKETKDIADRDPQASVAATRLPMHLEQLKPDVLVIPGWGYPIARTALKWAKQHRIPAILMSESKWDDEPRRWWKEKLKSLLYTRKFQAALVGGQLHKDYLVSLGMSEKAIFLGYDVVDNAYFTEQAQQARQNPAATRQQHPQIPDRPYFMAVTRFIPRKNILRLIEAFAQYRQTTPLDQAWDLVICGSGQESANISKCIQAHHLENHVYLPGFQTYQAIPYWFGLASAFIHPALSEQWGLVVNEALAAGLPAIVSERCGCYPELILEGVNGFGFDPEDANHLAQLMEQISSGHANLEEMRQAALTHIQKFSSDRFGQGLVQAIEFALSQSTT